MVYVLGGWQSDFAANWAREGIDLAGAFTRVVQAGLSATGLEPKDIECGHVGNFAGELFAEQGLLGGFFGLIHPDLDGLPAARHEAACASGSVAILAAAAEIEAGRYDLACIVGIEQMRNVPGRQAAKHLAAAAYPKHEFPEGEFVWPGVFSEVSDEYQRRYGLKYEHLMKIAQTNFGNAKRNPNAQTRRWTFNPESFTRDDQANPVVSGNIRKQDCGQISDGAAVVFLASPKRAAEYANTHGVPLNSLPRIRGWGHRTAPIGFHDKVKNAEGQPYVFPQVRRAIEDARKRAGIMSVDNIDVVETHDCFTVTEYVAIDHLGITAPGEAWKVIEEGDIEIGGRMPINPSGGLMGCGHPVGATGVRMALDAFKQVTGQAGDYQVPNARTCQTLNIGGSATTTVSLIIGA
jgi:acetyl-CoA C-acetyltransferase